MSKITPMKVFGIKHLVQRAYNESGHHQHLREMAVNAIEGGATRVEFMPACSGGDPTQRVDELGRIPHRLMVVDNGRGMTPDDLVKFMNVFGGSGKPIGDVHENFGVGAKTSSLPFNHAGLVVISYTEGDPNGSMVQVIMDPETGEYGLLMHDTDDGPAEVIDVPEEYARLKPDWLVTGTIFLCLGNTGRENTYNGRDGEDPDTAIREYLNQRFWTLGSGVKIWAYHYDGGGGDRGRRWVRREVHGAQHYATEFTPRSGAGKLASRGELKLPDGTVVSWFLRSPDYDWKSEGGEGYIAALYKNEIYDWNSHAKRFMSFGVINAKVRKRLTLIVEPPMSNGKYGVYPDTARNSLRIMGTKRAGESLPWDEWAHAFQEVMPQEIRDAQSAESAGPMSVSLDSTWKDRLQSLGDRFKAVKYVKSNSGQDEIVPDGAAREVRDRQTEREPNPRPSPPNPRPNPDKPTRDIIGGEQNSSKKRTAKGSRARSSTSEQGWPDLLVKDMADINDKDGEYAAQFQPPTKDAPAGTVIMAQDFPALVEARDYWLAKYPAHHAEEVIKIVNGTYGDALIAKVVHSSSLASRKSWGRSKVDDELRSQGALTMAVLGLIGEDGIILSKLSNKIGKPRG